MQLLGLGRKKKLAAAAAPAEESEDVVLRDVEAAPALSSSRTRKEKTTSTTKPPKTKSNTSIVSQQQQKNKKKESSLPPAKDDLDADDAETDKRNVVMTKAAAKKTNIKTKKKKQNKASDKAASTTAAAAAKETTLSPSKKEPKKTKEPNPTKQQVPPEKVAVRASASNDGEEDEDDWDTDSDDTDGDDDDDGAMNGQSPNRKTAFTAGLAIGVAATAGVAAVAAAATSRAGKNLEDEDPNVEHSAASSHDTDGSYETDSDDDEDDQNLHSFMSPTTAQKHVAMSTPFSPLPMTTSPSSRNDTQQEKQSDKSHPAFHTNSVIPFFGREKELEVLGQVVERITARSSKSEGIKILENEPEVVLVSGSTVGVGASHFIKEAFYNPARQSSSSSVFSRCISCRGICEVDAGLSSAPMQVFSDLLNDLIVKLLLPGRAGGKAVWKERMHEALGGEGPLLATLVPRIGVLMDLPGFGSHPAPFQPASSGSTVAQQKSPAPKKNAKTTVAPTNQQPVPPNLRVQFITQWDWNSPQRFQRLCLAVRDLLQAVAEYLPLVMIIDNLQALDEDAWSMLYTILKSQTLKNFLFVGIHSEDTQGKGPQKPSADAPDPPVWQFEQSLFLPVRTKQNGDVADGEDEPSGNEEDMGDILDLEIPKMPRVTRIHLMAFSKFETKKIVEGVLMNGDPVGDDSGNAGNVSELSRILYSWTRGNALCLIQTVQLLSDQGLLKEQSEGGQSWDQASIEQRIDEWKKVISKDPTQNEMETIVTARIKALPKKVKFVVVATAALQQTYFSSHQLYRVLKVAHPNAIANTTDDPKALKKNDDFPLSSSKDLEATLQRVCSLGLMKRLSRDQNYAFAHDIIRDCAYALMPKKARGFHENSKNPAARKDWQIHCRLGTEFSALAVLEKLPVEERDRYKFLAADQLVISQKIMWDDRNSIAKLLLETAELCIVRSAFASSIVYLETGINLLEVKEQFTADNRSTCCRIYLWLAKMKLACGNLEGAKDDCQLLLDQAKSSKDKVPVVQVYVQVLLVEGNRQEALDEALLFLEEMGESFPQSGVSAAIDRELDQLRASVRMKDNVALLRPKRITDKKTLDVLVLLANVLEISRLSRKRSIQELAMIRMMNLSLQFGFSRQYPMAFAYFSTALVQRGIKAKDAEMVKEAHRMGQICEKMARLGDFYGGQSVALFHWHVSHWKRLYKRILEPVLRVYNAQLDSGDFFHVDFSLFTYTNMHLASGYSLDRLDDNLQLFDGLYQDYSKANKWRVDFPRMLVSNMLGESEQPLIFFGDTVEEQERKIEEFEEAEEVEALEYLNFLRLYMAVFFNDFQLAEECLAKLSDDIDGIWTPWVLFFQCLVAISKLPGTKGPGRKDLVASIEEIKEQLVDWYNNFNAPNPNAMVSLLDAELMMAKNVGKKEFPAIKIIIAYDEAIDAAREDEMKHLEAYACERAALHFEAANLKGYVAKYMRNAHALYDQWNALAKIIEIENKYAKLLKISERRTRPMAASMKNEDGEEAEEQEGRVIGGGRGSIRPVNFKKSLKNGAKNTRREIKALFGIRRAPDGTPPGSPESKNSPTKSPQRLPPPKSSPFKRKQKPAMARNAEMGAAGEASFSTINNEGSPSEGPSSPSKQKSPSSLKSPRLAKPKLRLPFGGGKKPKKSNSKKTSKETTEEVEE